MARKKNNTTRNVVISISVIAILLFFVFGGNILQQVTGVSTYEDNEGKTHWLINGIATGVDQTYTFRSLPNDVTNSKGERIGTQEEASIFISKSESFCEYQLQKVVKTKGFLSPIPDLVYYELKAPERVALLEIRDDSGNTKIVDGTIPRTTTFFDNQGKLEITTLGLQAGKRDCQDGGNVAVQISGSSIAVKNKAELEDFYNQLNIFGGLTLFDLPQVRDNTAFLSNFEAWSVRGTDRFIGDLDIGNVEYVVDADQNYYESVVITPEKRADPRITDIRLQKEVETSSTSSVIVEIRNDGDSGSIVIDASSSRGDISPTSKSAILNDRLESVFTLKVPSTQGSGEVCFSVESTDGRNVDNECESFRVTEEEVSTFCGDGICQSNEAFSTCPSDCVMIPDGEQPIEADCFPFLEEEYTKVDKDYGFLYLRALKIPFYEPITTETQDCRLSTLSNVLIFLIIIIPLGALAITRAFPRRKQNNMGVTQ